MCVPLGARFMRIGKYLPERVHTDVVKGRDGGEGRCGCSFLINEYCFSLHFVFAQYISYLRIRVSSSSAESACLCSLVLSSIFFLQFALLLVKGDGGMFTSLRFTRSAFCLPSHCSLSRPIQASSMTSLCRALSSHFRTFYLLALLFSLLFSLLSSPHIIPHCPYSRHSLAHSSLPLLACSLFFGCLFAFLSLALAYVFLPRIGMIIYPQYTRCFATLLPPSLFSLILSFLPPTQLDYSTQQHGARVGSHTTAIDQSDFRQFMNQSAELKFDVMLEIKNKEDSALKALRFEYEHTYMPCWNAFQIMRACACAVLLLHSSTM